MKITYLNTYRPVVPTKKLNSHTTLSEDVTLLRNANIEMTSDEIGVTVIVDSPEGDRIHTLVPWANVAYARIEPAKKIFKKK